MSLVSVDAAQVVAAPSRFDTIIDVRSPAEFAEDHLPGAVNWPVLDNAQRREVGTLYKQVSALEARKLGAVLVARNIADHLERHLRDKAREWQPLVYCWRGGQRSGSLGWFLGQIGFRSAQLGGGYKAWRALVRAELDDLPLRFDYRVLCGRTGSGKTRLLQALGKAGAQVLDLEGLAAHRGSVLGGLPGTPQPSQKHFDSLVWQTLRGFDAARPVYVESESRKIGALRVPEALVSTMRGRGRCIDIVLDESARVRLLLEDYAHFAADVPAFCRLLDALVELRGRDKVGAWQALAEQGRWSELFVQLMQLHYDPLYQRSLRSSYPQLAQARTLTLADADAPTLRDAARQLLG